MVPEKLINHSTVINEVIQQNIKLKEWILKRESESKFFMQDRKKFLILHSHISPQNCRLLLSNSQTPPLHPKPTYCVVGGLEILKF